MTVPSRSFLAWSLQLSKSGIVRRHVGDSREVAGINHRHYLGSAALDPLRETFRKSSWHAGWQFPPMEKRWELNHFNARVPRFPATEGLQHPIHIKKKLVLMVQSQNNTNFSRWNSITVKNNSNRLVKYPFKLLCDRKCDTIGLMWISIDRVAPNTSNTRRELAG